jgi:plasmid stability protein
MRTTLTIEDDLAAILQKKAAQRGVAFKQLVNNLLRAGLGASEGSPIKRKVVKVVGRPLGLKPGYDAGKLNQLVDELEAEDYLSARHQS